MDLSVKLDTQVVTFARGRLLRAVEKAQDRIWLASPFLTAPIAAALCEAAAKSTAGEKRLLTALDARSVQSGFLHPAALSALQACGFEIASIANLHAKVALIDSHWGLVGSGNLTGAGLGGEGSGNYEMGVLLQPGPLETATEILADWWGKADPVTAKEIAAYAALPKLPKGPLTADHCLGGDPRRGPGHRRVPRILDQHQLPRPLERNLVAP